MRRCFNTATTTAATNIESKIDFDSGKKCLFGNLRQPRIPISGLCVCGTKMEQLLSILAKGKQRNVGVNVNRERRIF